MSYDDNFIKSKKTHFYFQSIQTDKKRKHNNSSHAKCLRSINNKLDSKLFSRKNQKQFTLGPLSSTLESTISSQKPQIDDDNSSLSSEVYQKITIKTKKLLKPQDDDMKFLFDIFYNSNQNYQYKNKQYNNNNRKSVNCKNNFVINNNKNDTNFYNYKYDFHTIKKYLIKIQKIYNINGQLMILQNYHNKTKSSGDLMDSYHLQKLEDLIARYSLIIFLYIKSGRIHQAKKLFLIMVKENIDSINDLDKKISSKYLIVNRKINMYRDIPKITYGLVKIYSIIIKYSQLFNITYYRNMFMDKYIKMQLLNYKFYMIKGTIRGFSAETRNQIKYFLSYCFHNISFYSIYYYFPLKVPIIFNYNILSLYNNFDETFLSDLEKSLLIKTSYNEGLLYYLNGQKDEALLNLNQSKEKIISFSDDYYASCNYNNTINIKNNYINMFKNQVKEDIIEINQNKRGNKKMSTLNPFNIKFIEERKTEKNKTLKILHKQSEKSINYPPYININYNEYNSTDNNIGKKSKDLSASPKNKANEIKLEIYKGFKKDKITIEDIELLVKFGKEKGLLNEEPVGSSKGLDFLFKYKESFSAIKKKITIPKGFRGSHIDFHTSMKIKDFFIPEKFQNPLLRKIEFLLALIEIDKKNYVAAYEHILKVLYIVFLLKLSSNYKYHKDFFNSQKMEINEYFKLIEESYEKDLQTRLLLEKSSSKSILTANDRKSKSNISNLNNSNSNFNNSFIIFENKDAENHFYQNNNYYKNNVNNYNINDINENYFCQNNNNNYNYICQDVKIIKEFEKFFIFLNNLSLYQIKILNETQPKPSKKRNDLPIIFNNQFKDCLTNSQRMYLSSLESMNLSRYIILNDVNGDICPENLDFRFMKYRIKDTDSEDEKDFFKYQCTKIKGRKYSDNHKTQDETNNIYKNNNVHSSYKKMKSDLGRKTFSVNDLETLLNYIKNKEIKEFIDSYKNDILKLLNNLNKEEQNEIRNSPNKFKEFIKALRVGVIQKEQNEKE